jgi:3-hydroxyacyl-CoA dehydrogenase/enoyl-CoA hydratase/3-hydroxybutyryl-CoA epimerase
MIQPQMPETKNWSFHRDVENLGWLTINTPNSPVNTLSREAIMELEQLVSRFEELAQTGELVGVILLSGKDSGFIAGADVSEFDAMSDFSVLPEALKRTHALFARIEKLTIPMVAGIHGFCLGGGLELALACHYRVAVNDDKTRIGFPEVNLGIFPGFGGTGRSIRQAGPVDAMHELEVANLCILYIHVGLRPRAQVDLLAQLVQYHTLHPVSLLGNPR